MKTKRLVLIFLIISSIAWVAFGRGRANFSKIIYQLSDAVGFWDTTPDYPIEILNTTTPQFAISHTDGVDYFTVAVDADGDTTMVSSGGDISFDSVVEITETAYFDTETDNGNSSTTDTIDWTRGNKQKSILTANCTFTFIEPAGACSLILKLVQDGSGSRTVTWPADVLWPNNTAPTLTTTAAAVDLMSFYYDGTDFYGLAGFDFR